MQYNINSNFIPAADVAVPLLACSDWTGVVILIDTLFLDWTEVLHSSYPLSFDTTGVPYSSHPLSFDRIAVQPSHSRERKAVLNS